MKKDEVKFIAQQYKNRAWTLWISRNDKKFMLSSNIKNEYELSDLLGDLKLEKSHYVDKDKIEKEKMKKEIERLQSQVAELESYKVRFNTLSMTLSSINETNTMYDKPRYKSLDVDFNRVYE